MKISVVLATCNGENYLSQQLESLLTQTRMPDELIIGDDVSDDRTIEIAQDFSRLAPFPTSVVRNPKRLGYMQNFSGLAARASGDILAFCDQDDIWKPNKLAFLEQYFSQNPRVTCVIHDIAVVDAKGDVLAPSLIYTMKKAGYSTNIFVKGCATAMKMELAQVAFPLPADSAWAHDNFAHVVAMISGTREIIGEPLIDHRIHGRNVSGFIAEKPTIRRRINMIIDNFEMSRMPSAIYPILLPKRCTDRDLDFMFNVASRVSNETPSNMSRSRARIRAMNDISRMKAEIRNLSARKSLALVMANRKKGIFREMGDVRIVVMEGLRILLRLAIRPPDPIPDSPASNS